MGNDFFYDILDEERKEIFPLSYKNNNEVDFEVIKSFFKEKLKHSFI